MGHTRELAEYSHAFDLRDIPDAALLVARTSILDTLACGVAGADERVVRGLRTVIAPTPDGPCTLWGRPERAATTAAALHNGTAAHALDFDDVNWRMNGHPSAPLLPAAFAMAERHDKSGADLLRAFIAGFEVQARVGQLLGQRHYELGFHPTATAGVFGATTAAALLTDLDVDQLENAFGIACSTAAGSRLNFGTDTKPLHAGLAAQSGILACELTRAGVTAQRGCIESTLGLLDLYQADSAPLPALRDQPLALLSPGVELKPYPSCRFTHRVIDAILALRVELGPDEPRSIECAIDPLALEILIHPRPTTGMAAKFSLPYCAAVTWLSGAPTLGSFADSRVNQDDVQGLLRRVVVHAGTADADVVTIELGSGARGCRRIEAASGHPDRPLGAERLRAKAHALADPVLGASRSEQVIETVEAITELTSVRALARALTPQSPSAQLPAR